MKKFIVCSMIVLSTLAFTGCSNSNADDAKTKVIATYKVSGMDEALKKMDELYPNNDEKSLNAKLEILGALGDVVLSSAPTIPTSSYSTSKQSASDYCSKMVLSDMKHSNDSGNYMTLTASVKNTGDKTIKYYEVTIKLYDKDGNVLDSIWTNNSGDFAPNESSKIEKMVKKDSNIASYRMYVSDVTFK